ncbi:MAG: hypothetical protein WC916_06520 [Candidatus Woesearchaeota archaeon]
MKYLPDIIQLKASPKPERFIFTYSLFLFVLGILLYIGIFANYYLLNTPISLGMNLAYIGGIILLLILETILSYVKYHTMVYSFYEQYFEINTAKRVHIDYTAISSMEFRANRIDGIFSTGTIMLKLSDGKKIAIKHIVKANEIYFFLQKKVKT